jgi:cytochrome b
MVVVLLVMVASVGLTGWLYTTDRFWGVDMGRGAARGALEHPLPVRCAAPHGRHLHVRHHRENLVGAMLHGRKRE